MNQINEHNNSSNQNNCAHDKMIKMIINLGSKKYENKNTSSCQITRLQNLLLISIFYIPENYLSNVDSKSDMIKVRTSSVYLSSILFYF